MFFLSWKGNETQIGQELLNVHMRKAASKILIVMFLSPALTTADSQEIVDFICELHSSTFLSFMDGFVVILLVPSKGEELKFSCDCYFCTIVYSEKKIKWHKNMRKTVFYGRCRSHSLLTVCLAVFTRPHVKILCRRIAFFFEGRWIFLVS